MIRILHCNNDNKNLGGAYIITRRVEEYIRQLGYTFDYLTMDEFVVSGNSDIDVMPGTRTYSAKLRNNRLIGHVKFPHYIYKVIKNNNYQVVHIDIDSAWKALFFAIPAKIIGTKVIVHSHSTGIDGDFRGIKKFAHNLSKPLLALCTDARIACSKEAAWWMFLKKDYTKTEILFNGIDFNRFYYSEELRETWRKKLGIKNHIFILGNVAALSRIKNQSFIIDILKKIRERGIDAELILAGVGSKEHTEFLMKKIRNYKLKDKVHLLGFVKETCGIMNAIDVFVFPSLFEGAPLAVYEAQSTGLSCLLSNTISRDSIVSDWVDVLKLEDGADAWAEQVIKVIKKNIDRNKRKVDEKYGIAYMAERLVNTYDEVLNS